MLLPVLQLGYTTHLGAEAAIHSTRMYLGELPPDYAMVKLDFKNALNSIRRDKVIEAALEHLPELYHYILCCYFTHSHLLFGESLLLSQEGFQQGDPLGPLLFCLVIHPLVQKLQSELKIFYLDDSLIGGPTADILSDIQFIKHTL